MTETIQAMETTGRYLVLLPEEDVNSGIRALTNSTGIQSIARSTDFENHSFTADQLENVGASVFESIGAAVVDLDPDQVQSIRAASETTILAVEPERVVYAIGADSISAPTNQGNLSTTTLVDGNATWGLQATNVVDSPYSGFGIKIAVLDTGFDLSHPDFAGRAITSKSFINGENVQDGNGHGTHCIGTACGPKTPVMYPRYGIAYNAEIYAGKVLSNSGSGSDRSILAGIEWALSNRCQVISMSLGAPTLRTSCPTRTSSRQPYYCGGRERKQSTKWSNQAS
jgi:subtilisin family serine protease